MISRYPILTGAFLLIVRCVSAGLEPDQMQGANHSSLDVNPGQEAGEFGRPLYRAFTQRDEGVVNRILSAVQDSRGLMIFGSVNCVLEYDSERWTSIPIPNGGWITALASDRSGTIWVGGTGEVGALVFDGGAYRYKSHTQLLPESVRHFGMVMSVAIHGDDVYFLCEKTLLHWTGQHFSVIPLPYELGNFWAFSSFSGRLFVHAKHQPFSEVVGDRLVPVLDDPMLRETMVIGAIELAKAKILLVTREKGIFEFHDSRVVPLKTDADDLFTKQSYINAAISINEGLFVVGVQRRGLVFLDAAGRIQQTFLEEDGLPTGTISDLRLDGAGGLWVIGDTSLTRVNPNRSISVFDHENGLPKAYVAATVRFGGFLYAVTGNGLYRLEPGNSVEAPPQFRKVPGITDSLYRALAVPPLGLLLTGDEGVYLFDGSRFQIIANVPLTYAIVRSEKNPDRFFLGGEGGLRALRFTNGQWVDEGTMPGFDRETTSIVETANGDLFIGSMVDGFFLIRLGQNAEAPFDGARLEALSNAPKPGTNAMCQVQALGKQLLFSSDRNIFLFRDVDRSFYQPDFIPRQIVGREIRSILAGAPEPDHLWLETVIGELGSVQAQEIGRLGSDGSYHTLPRSISSFLGKVKSFNEESSPSGSTLWISGEYGVVRVDLARSPQARPNLRLYSREGTTASGESLHLPQSGGTLELPFGKRDIRLRFATDDYDGPDEVRYRTKLDGLNSDWTPFFGEPTWQSGSLGEGQYCLHVAARNSEGTDSNEFGLAITIFPPWYRTPWMYAVYIGVGGLAVFGLIRWRLWQMRVREKELVAMCDYRTRELRQSEERLREAKDNAEAANRAKTAFLANMSHEVRTPLNSILGYGQLLLRGGNNVKDPASKLRSIIDSGAHLLGMMNELLDLARVESGKLAVNSEPLDLPSFLQSLVAEFEIRARQSGLHFDFSIDASIPHCIEIDPLRLRQILYNLVGNAFKFTNAGTVSLKVAVSESKLRLEVSDTGRGIAEADLPYLFKPFYQALNHEQSTEGIGLGLYITDKIVKLMGGQIYVNSVLGQGSKFWAELPVKLAALPAATCVDGQVVGYEGSIRSVLVVDDDRSNRDVIKQFLAEVGFAVEEADSGDAALGLMRSGHFDGVISDIRMTGKDGNALCREVRSDKTLAKIVMIASSASVYDGDRRDAESAGFNDFLPKPVKERELFRILERHLRLKWIVGGETESERSAALGSIQSLDDVRPVTKSTIPVEQLRRLLALTGEGDVMALRCTLQELLETDPAHAAFAERLMALVSAYRIEEVESLLQRRISEPTGRAENEYGAGRR
jgi:signal transduction histidine kinase/DNA-binding response OmpR family regulator